MLSDEKLRLIRRLAVQARNTDTGDESVNFALNAIMDGFDTLLDEITRLRADRLDLQKSFDRTIDREDALRKEVAVLRAENEQLHAARLSPETVNFIRHEMFIQWNRPEDADEEVDAVIADLDRCYPPDEV